MASQKIKTVHFKVCVDVYQLLDCMFSFYNLAVRPQDPRGPLHLLCMYRHFVAKGASWGDQQKKKQTDMTQKSSIMF